MMKDKNLINIAESRTESQRQIMEQIAKDKVCPFCEKHLAKYHHQPILWSNKSWLITKNDNPYEGTKLHLLFIAKRHIENPTKVKPIEYSDLGEAIKWSIKKFNIKGGSYLMRFGEMNYNGSSVQHLHSHIIVGLKKGKNTESIKVKVGYKSAKNI